MAATDSVSSSIGENETVTIVGGCDSCPLRLKKPATGTQLSNRVKLCSKKKSDGALSLSYS